MQLDEKSINNFKLFLDSDEESKKRFEQFLEKRQSGIELGTLSNEEKAFNMLIEDITKKMTEEIKDEKKKEMKTEYLKQIETLNNKYEEALKKLDGEDDDTLAYKKLLKSL